MRKSTKETEGAAEEKKEGAKKTAKRTYTRKTAPKDPTATAEKAVKAVEETAEKTMKAVGEVAEKTVKAVAEKAAEVKKDVEKASTKAPARRPVQEMVYLQYLGKEISKDDLMKQVKMIWTKEMKHKMGEMRTVTLYLKPEENRAYYVINGEVTGSIEL